MQDCSGAHILRLSKNKSSTKLVALTAGSSLNPNDAYCCYSAGFAFGAISDDNRLALPPQSKRWPTQRFLIWQFRYRGIL